jgi:hypothetical protein
VGHVRCSEGYDPENTTRQPSHTTRAVLAAIAVAAAWPALAFHSGGVADCEGCHSMHNSFEGAAVTPAQAQFTAGAYLLKGSDSSSVCLHCHQAAGVPVARGFFVSTHTQDLTPGAPPRQLTPGGDFGWVKKNYSWTPPGGSAQESRPERHGHNIVAQEYGYVRDRVHEMAPGGTYPRESLSCVSCHDPHGRYRRLAGGSVVATGVPILDSGSYDTSPDPVPDTYAVGAYRLLGGVGYQPRSVAAAFAFTSPPPDAVSPSVYNRSEAVSQTRVAYGRGMSEWCANCHPGMLRAGSTGDMGGLNHPVGNEARLPPGIQTNYIAYLRTGSVANVNPTRGYWSLVPFEEGTSNYATLKSHARTDDSYLVGPDASSNLSCITCHRAHASGFDGALRFRAGNAFITVADAGGAAVWPDPALAPAEAQGRTAAETQQAYYGRPASQFAPYQAPLCNKCHVKD